MLGGAEDARVAAARHVHALNEAGERMTEAAALARRYPKAKVVYTGGTRIRSCRVQRSTPTPPADACAISASRDDRLLLERKARNTWENAVYTKALVKPKPGERWLLVTSALAHAARDGRIPQGGVRGGAVAGRLPHRRPAATPGACSEPRRRDCAASRPSLHEWIGLFAYRALGRSDALLPGPQ